MSADFGPCSPWSPVWICDPLANMTVTGSAAQAAITGVAAQAATEVLWGLSGRRFGTCEITLRPCRKECYSYPWWAQYGPPWSASASWDYSGFMGYPWITLSCGSCVGTCSCKEISEVILPSPVSSIVSVKIDGVAVTGIYRLDNNRLLVRTDGQRWPRCNDLTLADTEVGTWSITALYGEDIPQMAGLAMGELTCELLKAMAGAECRLPPGVTQLARQGVTITIPDFGELFKDGRTGLYLVDMFLAWANPNRLMNRGRVYSVDRPPHRRPS